MFAEAVHLLLGARRLAPVKQFFGLVPLLPPVARRGVALPPFGPSAERFSLRLPELTLHAALTRTPAVVKNKSVPQLQPGELVLESARAEASDECFLTAGELITAHRLTALAAHPAAAQPAVTVAVVEVTAVSRAQLALGS